MICDARSLFCRLVQFSKGRDMGSMHLVNTFQPQRTSRVNPDLSIDLDRTSSKMTTPYSTRTGCTICTRCVLEIISLLYPGRPSELLTTPGCPCPSMALPMSTAPIDAKPLASNADNHEKGRRVANGVCKLRWCSDGARKPCYPYRRLQH